MASRNTFKAQIFNLLNKLDLLCKENPEDQDLARRYRRLLIWANDRQRRWWEEYQMSRWYTA